MYAKHRHYELVTNDNLRNPLNLDVHVKRLLREIHDNGLERFSIDTETTGLNVFDEDFKIVGVVLSTDVDRAYYYPMYHESYLAQFEFDENDPVQSSWLNQAIYTPLPTWQEHNVPPVTMRTILMRLLEKFKPVYHNSYYDRLVLRKTLDMDFDDTMGDDTILMAHLINENKPLSLKALAKEHLNIEEEVPQISPLDMEKELQDLLFDRMMVSAKAKNGRTYTKQINTLHYNWERELTDYYEKYTNGAVPFKFVMQVMGRAYTLMKRFGLIDFEGPWRGDFRHVYPQIALWYASDDAINTLQLYKYFIQVKLDLLPDVMKLYETVENPVNDVMMRATYRGIKVDRERLERMRDTLRERSEEIREEALYKLAKITDPNSYNPETILTSAVKLQDILYNQVGFEPVEMTRTGKPAVSKTALKKLLTQRLVDQDDEIEENAKEFIRKKLEFQDVSKLLNTYTDSLLQKIDSNGRIHPSYKVFGAVSGRMSSNDPNFQQLPRLSPKEVQKRPWLYGIDIRSTLMTDEDYVFVSADWSSMEMTLAAAESGDVALKKLLSEGRDLHAYTGKNALLIVYQILPDDAFETEFGMSRQEIIDLSDAEFATKFETWRQDAKVVNFSQLYAGTWYTLYRNFGFPKEKAKALEQGFRKAYPGLVAWMQDIYNTLEKNGQIVYPEFGYIKRMDMPAPYLRHKDPEAYRRQYEAAKRTCLNAAIQGYAAWIAKQAAVKTQRELEAEGLDAQVMYQVHDELGLLVHRKDAERAEQILINNMRRWVKDVWLDADPEMKLTMSKAEEALALEEVQSDRTLRPSFKAVEMLKDIEDLPEDEEDEEALPVGELVDQGVRRIEWKGFAA